MATKTFDADAIGNRAPMRAASRHHSGRWRIMRRRLGLPLLLIALTGGHAAQAAGPAAADAAQTTSHSEESRMWMTVGERRGADVLRRAGGWAGR